MNSRKGRSQRNKTSLLAHTLFAAEAAIATAIFTAEAYACGVTGPAALVCVEYVTSVYMFTMLGAAATHALAMSYCDNAYYDAVNAAMDGLYYSLALAETKLANCLGDCEQE